MNPTRPQPPSASSTTPADLPTKQHPPESPTPPSAQEPAPTPQGAREHTHPAAQARERDTGAPTALQTQPPPRRPWERPTASSRPPSSTQAAVLQEQPGARGSPPSVNNARNGPTLIAAALAVKAAADTEKADRFASIRGDCDPLTQGLGPTPSQRLPISRRSMEVLRRIVEDGGKQLEAGLLDSIGNYCRNVIDSPNATPEQRGYAANVGRGLVSTIRQAANDLDPMEVSEGLHQHAAGVEVTEGGTPGTTKIEATYSFKVTIE